VLAFPDLVTRIPFQEEAGLVEVLAGVEVGLVEVVAGDTGIGQLVHPAGQEEDMVTLLLRAGLILMGQD
jgi:hypothetical protein